MRQVPQSAINDDYCDCADGTDEPGTSACAGVTAADAAPHFYCPNENAAARYVYRGGARTRGVPDLVRLRCIRGSFLQYLSWQVEGVSRRINCALFAVLGSAEHCLGERNEQPRPGSRPRREPSLRLRFATSFVFLMYTPIKAFFNDVHLYHRCFWLASRQTPVGSRRCSTHIVSLHVRTDITREPSPRA